MFLILAHIIIEVSKFGYFIYFHPLFIDMVSFKHK